MGEAKTICHLCKRKPGTQHKKRCALGRRYRISEAWRVMRAKPCPQRWPIANIFDCVGGPLKTKVILKGTPNRVRL